MKTGMVAGAWLTFGGGAWRAALAGSPATPGPGPYGPLQAPDANGIMLPEGFSSRIVARAGAPVGTTGYAWPLFPDGSATYAAPEGGYVVVINSEVPEIGQGGASAIRFTKDGDVVDAYRILGGTSANCAGGPTPWGTWLSCEEIDRGQVWECDPTGAREAVPRPAMGRFNHEAACVDPVHRQVYLTEDEGNGLFYRFTPKAYPDLADGLLEAAVVQPDGTVRWVSVPDPAAGAKPTREQLPDATRFRRGEGIWFDSGTVYVATTADSKVHAYNTYTETIEVLYDGGSLPETPLRDVDNVTMAPSGDLFVCEDADDLSMGIITPEREVANFLKVTGPQHGEPQSEARSELAGVAFDPSGKRMYFSSQRAFGGGVTYEVTGPFRTARVQDAGPPAMRLEVPATRSIRGFLKSGVEVTVRSGEPVTATLAVRMKTRTGRVTLSRTVKKLGAGAADVRLRPGRLAAERLRGRRKVAATVTLSAVDAGGRRTVLVRPVSLTR